MVSNGGTVVGWDMACASTDATYIVLVAWTSDTTARERDQDLDAYDEPPDERETFERIRRVGRERPGGFRLHRGKRPVIAWAARRV